MEHFLSRYASAIIIVVVIFWTGEQSFMSAHFTNISTMDSNVYFFVGKRCLFDIGCIMNLPDNRGGIPHFYPIHNY